MTRLKVLADQQGNIIASLLLEDALARTGNERDAPEMTFMPQEGQAVHEVEVPADLLRAGESVFQSPGKYLLETTPEPRIVRRDGSHSHPQSEGRTRA
jgi:hypothetical protein